LKIDRTWAALNLRFTQPCPSTCTLASGFRARCQMRAQARWPARMAGSSCSFPFASLVRSSIRTLIVGFLDDQSSTNIGLKSGPRTAARATRGFLRQKSVFDQLARTLERDADDGSIKVVARFPRKARHRRESLRASSVVDPARRSTYGPRGTCGMLSARGDATEPKCSDYDGRCGCALVGRLSACVGQRMERRGCS
jgi:hypothetical protein